MSLFQTGKKAETAKKEEPSEEDSKESKSSDRPKDPFEEMFKDPR